MRKKRSFGMLIILLLVLLSTCFVQDAAPEITAKPEEHFLEKKANEFVHKAIDYAVEGNFEKALQEYKNASEIKNTQLAEKYLKLITDILNGKVKKDVGLHLFKGLQQLSYYNDPSKLEEAIVEFEWVTKVSPDCELAHYLLGYTCYHSNCATVKGMESVISSFNKAIEIDHNFAKAHFWLALAYCFGGETNDAKTRCQLAVEHYDKAISLDPSLKGMPISVNPAEPAEKLIGVCRSILKE